MVWACHENGRWNTTEECDGIDTGREKLKREDNWEVDVWSKKIYGAD